MKYAKNINGTVRVYATLPKTYENIINFQKAEIETINSKGFYELVEPILTQYQRAETLLVSDLIGTQFIQRVYNFTQAEIDALNTQTVKDEFKNNLEGAFAFATTPDGTKEYAIKIGNDGKIVTVLVP